MLKWTSSLFFHTGHVMCSLFFLFDSYFIWNTPKTTKNCWPSPHWKYVNLQPLLLGLFHGSNGLYLLKSISINFVWIHTGHVMCSLAHLDFFYLKYTPNNPELAHCPHWKHGHSQTLLSLLHGSNGLKHISISVVWIHTGHVMCSLAHLDLSFIWKTPKTAQNWPLVHSESMTIHTQFLVSSMDPMDCFG